MSLPGFLVFLALTTTVIAAVRWWAGTSSRATHVTHFEKQLGFTLPAPVRAELGRWLTVETWGTVVGTLVASALLVPVYLVDPDVGTNPDLIFYLMVPAVVGPAVAAAVASVVEAVRVPDGSAPRLARSRVVVVGDYVPRLTRLLGWGAVVGVVVVVTAVAVAGPTLPASALALSGGIAALAVVVLAVVEIVGRVLVRRPQPAHSADELVLDDAARAFVLRRMFHAPGETGVWALLALLLNIGLLHVVMGVLFGALVVLLGRLVLTARRQPGRRTTSEQHFLRRLWPAPERGTMAA